MDKALMIKDLVQLTVDNEIIEKAKAERKNKENAINKARDQNQERIYYVEQEMEIMKTQLQFIINIQKEHYLRLLKEG